MPSSRRHCRDRSRTRRQAIAVCIDRRCRRLGMMVEVEELTCPRSGDPRRDHCRCTALRGVLVRRGHGVFPPVLAAAGLDAGGPVCGCGVRGPRRSGHGCSKPRARAETSGHYYSTIRCSTIPATGVAPVASVGGSRRPAATVVPPFAPSAPGRGTSARRLPPLSHTERTYERKARTATATQTTVSAASAARRAAIQPQSGSAPTAARPAEIAQSTGL